MKIKISLIIFSIAILTLIPLMKNNFGAPVTFKKWAPLSWDDFQGIARPFSAYAAAINSYIYLEYDSVHDKHVAYAAQNNQRSWVQSDLYDPEYVLNHEQYHFNISEVHARMLNKRLDSLDDQDPYELLASYQSELLVMQNQFDNETDHGRRTSIQRKWEYQIDSMLQNYLNNSTYTNEFYSGAQVFFPIVPINGDGALENGAFKNYSIYRYDMNIALVCYVLHDQTNISFDKLMEQKCSKDSLVIESFEKQNSQYGEMVILSTIDTAINTKEISHWYYHKPYVYQLYADYPLNVRDTIGYEQIANSFFNSFNIINTNNHFLSKIIHKTQVNISKLENNMDQNESVSGACMTYMPSKSHGFFRGPIHNDNGDMLLAIDVIEHEDSLLFKNIMVIDNMMFDSETGNGDQLIFIPKHNIPEGDYWLSFGYFLLEDSSKACYNYYNQMMYIDDQSF